jgi:hypothetical protein
MLELTLELALDIIQIGEPHPITLDEALYWLGYPDKASAKHHLERISDGWDYRYPYNRDGQIHASNVGDIVLTIRGFMTLAVLADTEAGDYARELFIAAEKIDFRQRYEASRVK